MKEEGLFYFFKFYNCLVRYRITGGLATPIAVYILLVYEIAHYMEAGGQWVGYVNMVKLGRV